MEEIINSESLNQTYKKDICVICGKESPYTYSTHINLRIGYIEGAGQGCFKIKKCENAETIY